LAQLNKASYQLIALSKLLTNNLSAVLICDGVGVGKTIAAGYILAYLTTKLRTPALVVCPPSLPDKWRIELKSKFNMSASCVRSYEELDLTVDHWNNPSDDSRVYILPSSLLLSKRHFQFAGPIVFDEIHNFRNPKTISWAAAYRLAETSPYRIGLSATPINNGTGDLAAELAILLNLDIHTAGAVVDDVWRPGRQHLAYPLMTRFAKDRLGIHFAKRVVHDVRIGVSERYRNSVIEVIKGIRERPQNEAVYRDEITYFRLASSSSRAFRRSTGAVLDGEFPKAAELAKVLASHFDEHVIVFCEFEETAIELQELVEARPSFLITGSVPAFSRQGILAQFQQSSNGVLVMTSVGAEGIDLQFCSTLVNYDLTWNPMILEQRIGRIDRIGQAKSEISIYNFIVEGSIDERIVSTLGRKLGLVSGSILEPSAVLSHGSRQEGSLFNESAIEEELAHAEELARAIALTSAIIPDDYALLPCLDSDYCDSAAIRSAAKNFAALPWIRDYQRMGVSFDQLANGGSSLKKVIAQYQLG